MSFIERMILKKNALEAPNNTMLTYGVSTDGHGTVTNVEPAMAFAELTNSNTKLTDYSNRIGILTAQASKKLEELTALNTGSRSPEFRRMITTLTDVTKLSNKSTPADATMYNNYIISLYKGWLNGVVETIENKKGNTMNNKYFTACGIVEMIGKILLVRHTYGTAKNK